MLRMKFMNKVLIVLMSLVLKRLNRKANSTLSVISNIIYVYISHEGCYRHEVSDLYMDIVLVSDTVTDIKYFRISLFRIASVFGY